MAVPLVDATRRSTVALPVSQVVCASGAVLKAALWPGGVSAAPASAPRRPSAPSPGRLVSAAGLPPAGEAISRVGPASGRPVRPTGPGAVTPGSAGAERSATRSGPPPEERVTTLAVKPGPAGAARRRSQPSSQPRVRSRSRPASGAPPSWPPPYQTRRTGVPAAAIPRALASASRSGNSVSASPCSSSVGAVTRSSTRAGLDAAMSA